MALVRPRLYWQIAFNAHPNDRFGLPLWTDVSHMYKRLEGPYSSGSQYELGQAQASQPSIRWLDTNEYLNPANTGSPYYPNVLPFRRVLGQAVYPPAGTGNLLNASAWRPNDAPVYDPSFESYANGAALPGWLTAVGGVSATVTTTTPQQGTKSVTYAVAGTATPQGLACTGDSGLPCIPGQQYTVSAYVRQSTASTQWLLVGDQTLAYSTFSGSASSGWAAALVGGSWTTAGGSATDYSESGGKGRHSVGTLNVRRHTTIGSGIVDADETVTITAPAVITGGSSDVLRAGILARFSSVNDYYRAEAQLGVNGVVSIVVFRRSGGVDTQLGTTVTKSFVYAAGTDISLRLKIDGSAITARCWLAAQIEPDTWDISATDTTIATGGAVGCTTLATSGVTNALPLVVAFDSFATAGSTASSTTTTTGAYVRLSLTFTATQPRHTLTIRTRGTAVAGTVNIDAIQHEIGAAATAFATSGAIVAPFMDGYIERWTREYEDQGFTGYAVTPVIDALAVAASIALDTEYAVAAADLNPTHSWPLAGQDGATVAPELSGLATWLFQPISSIFGAGTLPQFGTAIDIPGAAGITGVKFTPPSPPDGLTGEYTFFRLGGPSSGVSWPRSFHPTQWGLSMAVWVQAAAVSPATIQYLFISYSLVPFGSGLTNINPMFVYINTSGHVVATSTSRTNLVSAEGTTDILDDRPHLITATLSQVNGGDTVMIVYVDGVAEATATVTTASLGGMYTEPAQNMSLGAGDVEGFAAMVNGTLKYLNLWERTLAASEVTALWSAGGLGYAGELTGSRLERRLRDNNYGGKLRVSAGSSTMQPVSSLTDGLTEIHNITNVEAGKSWSARDGALVFEGRMQRWQRITPRGIFGEDTAAGEIPYLEEVQFDFDPFFVFALVQTTRINGATAYGGTPEARVLAARKYFPRAAPADQGDYATDELAQYKADWVFNTHKEPLLRVSVITLDPGSNPALWPTVLNLENGQRWTVKRRAKAANGGAGLTISGDYFIEQITHNSVNMDNDQWTVTMFLSPVGLASASPGVTFQPWILGDATYGVLGSTTVLGW